MQFHNRRLLAIFASLLLSGCGLFSDPDERVWFGQEPEPLEYQYVNLAGHIQSEKPCYLISRKSLAVGPMDPPGQRANFMRSSCFYRVAVNAERPELCDLAISVSTILYSGAKLSRDNCRLLAIRGNVGISGAVQRQLLVEKAGVTDSEIEELLLGLEVFSDKPEVQAYHSQQKDRYRACASRYMIYSEQFFNRIDQLPHFGSDDDLEKMQAIEWSPLPRLNTRNIRSCLFRGIPDTEPEQGRVSFPSRNGAEPSH